MFVFAYINELLQVFVEIGQVVAALLVLGNQLLLALLQLEALQLQLLALCPLVVDARDHKRVLVVLVGLVFVNHGRVAGISGVDGQELVDGDERELLIAMPVLGEGMLAGVLKG